MLAWISEFALKFLFQIAFADDAAHFAELTGSPRVERITLIALKRRRVVLLEV